MNDEQPSPAAKPSGPVSSARDPQPSEPSEPIEGKTPASDPAQQSIEYSLSLVGHYSGPLPPASELAKYEEAIPGAGKVIVESFQEQQRHRMVLEERGQRNFLPGIC